jgi:NAD(P)-dependent dehydrogenase (short-subunit alcohol dehydrogenase family)
VAQEGTLKGRVALITGTTGLIGRAAAEALARAGAALVLACQSNMERAEELGAECTRTHGVPTRAMQFDVRDAKAVAAAVASAASWRGNLDILVTCHGLALRQFLRFTPAEQVAETFAVNTIGTIYCVQAAVAHMTQKRFGRVVLVGSAAASGRSQYAVYAASKAALAGLVRAASKEYAAQGITFNVVSPGVVEGSPHANGQHREKALAAYPVGRFVTADEVGAAIVFLAEAAGGSLTGQDLVIDGAEVF